MNAPLSFASALCLLAPVGLASDFTERAKAQGITTTAGDRFGSSVATDDLRTVVGSNHNSGSLPGRVHVMGGCTGIAETHELFPGDGFGGDQFGFAVAIDGDRIVVGAPQNNVGPGAVYVFHFDGAQWNLEQKLTDPGGAVDDQYGRAVDIQDDLIVVGAPGHDGGKGAAYLYRFDGTQWGLEEEPYNDAVFPELFGSAVAVDGDRVAIGIPYDTPWFSPPGVVSIGSVQMLRNVGGTWLSEGILTPYLEAKTYDLIGTSIALQGDRLLIGCPGVDDDLGVDARGQMLAYEFDPSVGWLKTQTLVPADAIAGDSVGWQVALDGNVAVVNAYLHDAGATDTGCAFLYVHDGTQWVESQKIVTSDAAEGDRLYSLALHGGVLIAGALGDDDKGADSGSVYVFADSFLGYGVGVAGAGAFMPTLDAVGDATPGGQMSLQMRDFVGGANCCYVTGIAAAADPFHGGHLFFDSMQLHWGTPFLSQGMPGVAGDGDVDIQVLVPNDPSLACLNLYIQGFAIDPGALAGVAMTNGLQLLID